MQWSLRSGRRGRLRFVRLFLSLREGWLIERRWVKGGDPGRPYRDCDDYHGGPDFGDGHHASTFHR